MKARGVACRFSLVHGLLLSGLIHAAFVSGGLALTRAEAAPPVQMERLNLDILGLISTRQVDERQAATEEASPQPPPPRAAPVPPRKASKRRERVKKVAARVPHPVVVPLEEEAAEENPGQAAQAPAAQDSQAAQTVSARELEATLMRRYSRELTRVVQSRLVYPLRAKTKGWTGVASVAFTVDEEGRIVPGSVAVQKSSGHATLDEAALKAVQSVEAFPKPPRRMEVVVGMNFQEMGR